MTYGSYAARDAQAAPGREELLGDPNTRIPERLVSHSEADFDIA